ncbi:hypothetical protein [Frondihabitans australicus]|uniref:hypothetical protein n=1 Tax=Frondihabitans australicus TaxID=386892 RepID=UPI0011C41B5F|nr:hypothetical protein [Frondihabitans australicus]
MSSPSKRPILGLSEARSELGAALARFRKGDATPLIFGRSGVPEAAIIPFRDFQEVLRLDGIASSVRSEAARES